MMPHELEIAINTALDAVRRGRGHEMNPRLRLAIYAAIGPQDDSRARSARGWLAIVCAQKVLPIFHQAVPEEGNPAELIEMAIAAIRGEADLTDAIREAYEGSELASRLWGYDEDEIPFNAQIAGNTGYRALYEAAGWNLLERPIKTSARSGRRSEPSRLSDRGDRALAQIGGDTASAAAIAFACIGRTAETDSQKLLNFWEWWLIEAIPSAWIMSSGNS